MDNALVDDVVFNRAIIKEKKARLHMDDEAEGWPSAED